MSHAETEMRYLNWRTDIGAGGSIRGVGNLLRRLRFARRYNFDDYARLSPDASMPTIETPPTDHFVLNTLTIQSL